MSALQDFIVSLGTSILIGFFIVFLFMLLFFIGYQIVKRKLYAKQIEKSLTLPDFSVLKIKIPHENDVKVEAVVTFLQSLHRFLPTGTIISLEMVSTKQFLSFYVVSSKKYKHIIESQLYAQFPDAEVTEVKDYLSQWKENTAYQTLYFKHHSMNPLKDFQSIDDDLLKNLSALLAKTDVEDEVVVQFVLKRVGSKSLSRGYVALYEQFIGRNAQKVAKEKLAQNLYIGRLRVAYTAKTKNDAVVKLSTFLHIFKSVKSSYNELVKKTPLFPGNTAKAFQARFFEGGDLWTIPEIAAMYHFPTKGIVVSNVVQTNTKKAPAPDILPVDQGQGTSELSLIGKTNYRNEHKLFGLKRIDRRRHVYIIGKTGSGKSKLLELLLKADIEQGKGCCLIDPHGDLALEALNYVPQNRIRDVVYIDPTDRNFPIGFNPLEPVEDFELRQHLATFFIAIFKKLFAANWNPRMENLIRYITLALLETPDSNVLGISRILSDTAFRQRVIKQIQDPVVKAFWLNDFKPSDAQYNNEAIIPVMNKVGQFIANPLIRNIIGQKKNSLPFDKFMNEGKIVIINLSKGKLGEENTALLGSMFITKIQQAALQRSNIVEQDRKDFYFYVDEFQNFATEAFTSILSEARKYRLNLTIAHQYIAQLPEDIKATAFGNVGTIIAFSIGGDDAAYLAKEFAPTFNAQDMISLNAREMYIKMIIDGKVTPPFSAITLTVVSPTQSFVDEIVNTSRTKYAQTRASVENEIAQWTSTVMSSNAIGKEEFPEPLI